MEHNVQVWDVSLSSWKESKVSDSCDLAPQQFWFLVRWAEVTSLPRWYVLAHVMAMGTVATDIEGDPEKGFIMDLTKEGANSLGQ